MIELMLDRTRQPIRRVSCRRACCSGVRWAAWPRRDYTVDFTILFA